MKLNPASDVTSSGARYGAIETLLGLSTIAQVIVSGQVDLDREVLAETLFGLFIDGSYSRI